MAMKLEVERKFLVRDARWREAVFATRLLRDAVIALPGGGKLRIRIEGSRAWLAVKGPRSELGRLECEYDIPLGEAEALVADFSGAQIIEKVRHLVEHEGRVWEVDVYQGALAGLVHAEVEVDSADDALALPDWVGTEITGSPVHSTRLLLEYQAGCPSEMLEP